MKRERNTAHPRLRGSAILSFPERYQICSIDLPIEDFTSSAW